ncbi:MAG: bifunctional riboflavin kinase/FMN adenylyltransferase, partial [Caulobacterales bacterium]
MIKLGDTHIFTGEFVLPAVQRGAVFAMGNFDGMHPGHQGVLDLARAEAKRRGALLGMIVLEPLPRQFFKPDAEPFRLTTREQRRRLAAGLGVDLLIELTFDAQLAQQSDRDFCQEWVARQLGAGALAVGFDFSFGKGRAGTTDSLRALGAEFGFELLVTPEIEDVKGEKVSSSH